ncbi:translation initiation factor 2 subunit alpha [Striga asiatica]|uniref:Translation initiation factor 2 subunit alpha n=1 Tax=Striga asiatica TaxID=4170 RepID=A0A5A7R2U9_STRAF|nr:translation initiation factor 2 subunit alpha [Striga asiatica]
MESEFPAEQIEYLFNNKWTYEVQKSFARFLVLVSPHLPLLLEGNRKDAYSLYTLWAERLTTDFGKCFTPSDCQDKYEQFKIRHRVMRDMIKKHGIKYCYESGMMWGPVEAWNTVDPISVAYKTLGDPLWVELQQMFGEFNEETVHPAVQSSAGNGVMPVQVDVDSLKGKHPLE